jgi:hypothetical protein
MASTVFVDNQTVILAAWLNDVNASVYQGLFGPTISYVDTGVVGSFVSTTAGYNQLIVQNKSNSALASANINASNDAATTSTNFVEMGINSSTFTGTGSFNQAGNAYVASASTDLVLGTYGPKSIRFVVNSGATDAMIIDSNGNVAVTSGTGSWGYGTGAGGTVTQATNKGTAVTINKPTGSITLNAASLASGAGIPFTVNNSLVTVNDTVIITTRSGSYATAGAYRIQAEAVTNGAFQVFVLNQTAGALSEALVINFAIIKGAIA